MTSDANPALINTSAGHSEATGVAAEHGRTPSPVELDSSAHRMPDPQESTAFSIG
jgi:hypothetical protein